MKVFFHKDAEIELNEAADYYEDQVPGLGIQLVTEIYLTVQRIMEHPHAWPVIEGDIRRALVRRFPYGVLYAVHDGCIFILAVMHLHREPGYWKERNV